MSVLAVLQDTGAGEAVSTAVGTYAHAFSAAVVALLPQADSPEQRQQQQQVVPEQNGHSSPQATALANKGLPELLLMCHHPAITAGVGKRLSTWHTACHRVRDVGPALKGRAGGGYIGLQEQPALLP